MANDPINDTLLDLSTPTTRRTFKVDGKAYEFRNRDELSLVQLRQLQVVSGQIEKPIENEGDAAAHELAVDELLRITIVDFDDVPGRLGYNQKKLILETFRRLLLAAGAMSAAAPVPPPTKRGTRSRSSRA